jgi:multidrug efflux pump subunit AcrA (membrane-fusion protein)
MNSRTLLILGGIVLAAIIVTNIFKGDKDVLIEEKPAYEVETVMAGALTKEITLQKSALMKAGTQANITAQASGRMGGIYVRAGERVIAGQILAEIDDTYGTTNNARDEAAIALETSKLSLASTTLSLDQSVASTKIAYEKAQKDYEAAKLSTTTDPVTGKSKAQLDYENFITTQEKTLSGYETTYQSQLQSFQSFLANVIDTTDTLLGVSDAKRNANDTFDSLLWAGDTAQRTKTEDSLQKLLPYRNWTPNSKLSLIERVIELQKIYLIANEVLSGMETVLINTIADSSRLPSTTIATYRASIDGYQTQYSSISTGLVSYLNAAQTFLATYEKERLSREKTVQTAEENSRDSLQLAKNAYETAQKSRDVTLRQLNQNISAAAVRLRNAQGNVNRLTITAPVSGVVGKVQVDEGEEVTAGRAIIDIASDDAECDITVDSATLAQLEIGTDVRVSYRGESLPGKIASISPIADRGLNFSVKIGVNAPVSVYGDFATIDIPMTSVFPTLPLTAVNILAPGQWQVYIVKTSAEWALSVETKNVILGTLWNDRVEITSDLNPADEIILSEMRNYNALDFILIKKQGTK